MTRPTPTQFAAYQRVFDYFNQALFDKRLPDCMLSFSRHRRNSDTLFKSDQWQRKTGSAMPEISLNLKQLREDRPMEAMAALVRQMVHLWQEKYGHPSRNGYYNLEWADKMEELGLVPTSTGMPGGRRTGQTLKHYIARDGRFERAFLKMPKRLVLPFYPTITESRKFSGMRNKTMYRCPGCGTKVWGKGGLGIVCECGNVFDGVEGEAIPDLGEKVYKLLAAKYVQKEK